MNFLNPFRNHIYAILRIAIGLLFACHGAQKIFGLFGGAPAQMPPAMLYTAGLIELVGGLLVAIGFQSRIAAFLCSGQMAVAYFMVHQSKGVLPIENHGELAAIYAFVFLYIAAKGDGNWSVGSS